MFEGCSASEVLSCTVEEFGAGKPKTRKMKNKRRFSDEQIKSLESIFENETKLEPRKKMQLARDLGLQPRQVAIWFQNKRARWKSKQLEREYNILRNNYNALASRFDNLKKDKQSLMLQVQKLKELVGKTQEGSQCGGGDGGDAGFVVVGNETNTNDRESESNNHHNNNNNNNNGKKGAAGEEEEEKPILAMEEGSEYGMGMLSDEGCSDQNTNYFTMDEGAADLLAMVEPACSSLTSDEEWHSLQSDGLFDQSTSSCEWWDFWK